MAKLTLSSAQKLIILNLIEERKEIISSKFTSKIHNDSKEKAWQSIVEKCRDEYAFKQIVQRAATSNDLRSENRLQVHDIEQTTKSLFQNTDRAFDEITRPFMRDVITTFLRRLRIR